MSLQDILQKIIDEAKTESNRIKSELESEKATLLAESEKTQKEEKDALSIKKKASLEKIETKIDSMARREVKQKMLQARHDIVTEAMSTFAKHLKNLSDDKYGEILKKLFSNITEKEGTILAPSAKLALTKKFAPAGFIVEADDSIESGFVAKLGRAEIDNSFENLVFSEFHNQIRAFFAEKLGLI